MVARVALSIAVACATACSIDTARFDDRGCTLDSDCRPDQSCRESLCTQTDCTAPSDCGPGYQFACESGGCVVTPCAADGDCGLGFLCKDTVCTGECAGIDEDQDGICDTDDNCLGVANRSQTDEDNDRRGDACDACPIDPDNDADTDLVCGNADNCPVAPNTNQFDCDADGAGDECDADDDNDGVADPSDTAPLDPNVCEDADTDSCDDCAIGVDDFGPMPDKAPANDGADSDSDGQCDTGDTDDDNDGVADAIDLCATGEMGWISSPTVDVDGDGCRDASEDSDDDNDGVQDGSDPFATNPALCGDADADTCDDCAIGADGFGPLPDRLPANDGVDTDADGECNQSDPDDDNDSVADAADVNPTSGFACRDVDTDSCDDCAITGGPPSTTNDGLDTDGDGACNAGDNDDDGDTVLDASDAAPLDRFACRDGDVDACDDCAISGVPTPGNDGADTDADGGCNTGDTDDDNDGIADATDPQPTDPTRCGRDADADTCDDCAVGVDGFGPALDFNAANDGLDTDGDGQCNAGDPDDDDDTVGDAVDANPLDDHVCVDADGDGCNDCAVTGGPPSMSNDGADADADGQCNTSDNDDDNDTVLDGVDTNPTNRFLCRDADADGCDDCSVTGGPPSTIGDGPDNDGDERCDSGDTDDDNDTVADGADGAPFNRFACRDVDADSCDDCSVTGAPNPANDGPDTDGDGGCNASDADDDNDTVNDGADSSPFDRFACRDLDSDTCDDCAITGGPPSASNDGADADADGACNASDGDDDNDGVADAADPFSGDPTRCGRDVDADTCDDCAVGVDGFGPAADFVPANDGTDTDADGACNAGDSDDDGDSIADLLDGNPLDRNLCADADSDGCDDCAVTGGPPSVSNDGTDSDADGECNTGDDDDDNDTVLDASDNSPLNRFACRDNDTDVCDDCAVTGGPPSTTNDGLDTNADGQCNASDPDDDGDTVLDAADGAPLDRFRCRDVDSDACDDCSVTGGPPSAANDGVDADMDGICDVGDSDTDGDTVPDASDSAPNNRFLCQNLDGDGCDDCAVTGGPPSTSNDGPDPDGDGGCNASDPDDDNDGVADGTDPFPVDPAKCGRDVDADTCDDCAIGVDGFGPAPDFVPGADGTDTDADGNCNAGDPDDDGDTVNDLLDTNPINRNVCADADSDSCDDCAITGGPPTTSNDGTDTDSDGQCNTSDADDDNDAVLDGVDTSPTNRFICRDTDADACDDCSVTGGPPNTTNDGTDTDGDGSCNAGDSDDDGDTVADAGDNTPLDPFRCRDTDADTCDDCSVTGGPPSTSTDGPDTDADGQCNANDGDDDGDTVPDGTDTNPLNKNICRDQDADSCDDCAVTGGPPSTSNDGADADADGSCNAGDGDDDNDGVLDGPDTAGLDPNICGRDVDVDTCDDCAIGVDGFGPAADFTPANDGTDTDADGSCNSGDADDDGDTINDLLDPAPLDEFICRDADADNCDDCAVTGGPPTTSNDGTDTDTDGLCNAGDNDDDGDTVLDASDTNPVNKFVCRDQDADSCDDCNVTGGPPSTSNDGTDTDTDGSCNTGDTDDDNDGVADGPDLADLDPDVCRDADADGCDDCTIGTDNLGPLSDATPANDGVDTDTDGSCNTGDTDDDNDGVPDASDPFDADPNQCGDVDADTCDDCSVGTDGLGALSDQLPNDDGTDSDGDGQCDAGEPCNLEITFIAGGAQVASATTGAMITPALPAGSQSGDLAIVFVAGRPSDNTTDPATPTGWTKRTASYLSIGGASDLKLVTFYKLLAPGDTNPTFTVPATWPAGMSAAIAAWRGIDPSSPFDAADVSGNSSSSTTWIPPGITTTKSGARVISAVATSDENSLGLAAANGFASRMAGTSYDTSLGDDHALGVADVARVVIGAATAPTWGQSAVAPDSWAGVTFALRPLTGITCTSIAQLAGGGQHTCARLDTGDVRCWGRASSGQLGYANTTAIGDTETPASAGNVNVGGTVTQVVAGLDHTCALLSTGAVRCWGSGANGRLGYGNVANIGDNETPSTAGNVSVGGTVVELAAGDAHTCARLTTGDVRCWGEGDFGRLGLANTSDIGDGELPSSVAVVSLGGPAAQITAGSLHTCALLASGAVRCWGEGDSGRLGRSSTSDIGDNEAPSSGAAVSLGAVAVAQLAAGGAHTCARLVDGNVRCWGDAGFGQLGLSSVSDIGDNESPSAVGVISIGGSAAEITVGREHTCARLTTGVIRCWGRSNLGQLGYGSTSSIGDTELPSSAGPISFTRAALQCTSGYNHTCALFDTGGVRCWGDGADGRLGYANVTPIGDDETASSVGYVQIE